MNKFIFKGEVVNFCYLTNRILIKVSDRQKKNDLIIYLELPYTKREFKNIIENPPIRHIVYVEAYLRYSHDRINYIARKLEIISKVKLKG
jgi:hypothetical protein